jgi:hypothetical protein
MVKPNTAEWLALIRHLADIQTEDPAELIIFDTISNFWPVKDENDASQVQAALMPLHQLTPHAAVALVHHLNKADATEGRGSRGSGALPGFVDTIVELRRFAPQEQDNRKRVLTGYGRSDDVPSELVIELAKDGSGYDAHGDRKAAVSGEIRATLLSILPKEAPGFSYEQIVEEWPGETAPRRKVLLDELKRGSQVADWRCEGKGKRGSSHTYWVPTGLQRTLRATGSASENNSVPKNGYIGAEQQEPNSVEF